MSGRIGKVRMKATGLEFRVINGPPDPASDAGANLMANARELAEAEDMTGYLIVSLHAGGGFNTAFRWNDKTSPVPRTLMPSYMAEIIRRELITTIEASDEFDRRFEWVE
jgi:hypothetical protein